MKQTSGPELVGAVRTVAAGQSTLDAHTAQRVMERLREQTSGPDSVAALSGQEKRVLDLIGEGLTNREIAERMLLSEKTAKNYVSSLLAKLGMQRRSQAAAFVARLAGASESGRTGSAHGARPFRFRPPRGPGRGASRPPGTGPLTSPGPAVLSR